MDQRCDAGTRPRDEAAVPLVQPCAHHQGARQGTSGRAAEAGKIAHRSPRRPPGGIQGDGHASMDGGRTARMYRRLGEVGIERVPRHFRRGRNPPSWS